MSTPGSSDRKDDPGPKSKPAASTGGGLSDRWSDDENQGGGPGEPKYDMTLPEDEKATMTMASPLIRHESVHHDGGSQGDIESGRHMTLEGAQGTMPAGRGALEFGAKSSAPKDVRNHVKAVIQQNKELVQPSVVRNLILTYTITVLVVMLLSIAGQVAVHVYIENSKSDAVVINVSGRQRMLSQLLVKDALALAFLQEHPSPRGPNTTYFLSEMKTRLAIWESSHEALINGTQPGAPSQVPMIPGTSDGAIRELARQQEPLFQSMRTAAQNILNLETAGNISETSAEFSDLSQNIWALLANEGQFWKLQDNMTLIFQQNADSHLQVVLIISWVLHILVIVTLILEGVCVFWPVARNMQRLIDERFNLIRRSLESEAENRGVSILMMGYISHELRQPLENLSEHLSNARDFMRSLESQAAAAGDGGPGDGSADPLKGAAHQLDKAIVCSELLNTVSGDITNLRNIELGRMALVVEVVDVSDVIQQVLSVLAPKIPEGVQMSVDVAPSVDGQNRRMDRHRLQQILLNLVDNAFRSTHEGEVVVRVKEGKSAATLRFEVQDSGEGLTEEQRQSLYEPTMDSSGLRHGDTNLSLYVVKLLVELQNGKYGVDTVAGGNLHWVELPATGGGPDTLTHPSGMQSVQEVTSGRTNSSSGRVVPEQVP